MIAKRPKKKAVKPAPKAGSKKASDIKQATTSPVKLKKPTKAPSPSKPAIKAEKPKKTEPIKKVTATGHKKAVASKKSEIKIKKITTEKTAKTVKTVKTEPVATKKAIKPATLNDKAVTKKVAVKAARPKTTGNKMTDKTKAKPVSLKSSKVTKNVAVKTTEPKTTANIKTPKIKAKPAILASGKVSQDAVAAKKAATKIKPSAVKTTSGPKSKGIAKEKKVAQPMEKKKPLKANKTVIPQTTGSKPKKKTSATEKKSVSAIKNPATTGKTIKTTKKAFESSSALETKPSAILKEEKKTEKASSPIKTIAKGKTREKKASATAINTTPDTFLTGGKKAKRASELKLPVTPPEEKEIKISAKRILKIFLPAEGHMSESIRETPYMELPIEYGENELLLMVVDPDVIYANWEIKKTDIAGKKDILYMRFFDVTGVEFDGANAYVFFDIKIDSRIGSGFYDIRMHGKDVIAEIGLLGPGSRFRPILRSNKISIPHLVTFDELGIAQKLFDSGIPVGY